MNLRYPDARTWAQEHSLASVPSLARLEGYAFQAHPDIVATFGADGASLAKVVADRRRSPGRTVTNWLIGIIGVIAVLAPIVGVAVYGSSRMGILLGIDPVPARVAVPVAGVCFMISAITQLGLWVVWLRGGARWAPVQLWVAAISAVLALLASVGLPNISARDGFELGSWLTPVWVTAALGGTLAIAILLRRKSGEPEPSAEPLTAPPTMGDLERARIRVRQLPAAEQQSVRSDRDGALQILHMRGLIDNATMERALSADLGTLFALDQTRRGT